MGQGSGIKDYIARFEGGVTRSPSVESFRFSVPGGIPFRPGQFCQVVFDREDRRNNELNKYLSFSSSPLRDYVEVTKKLSESPFSGRLRSLKKGDEVLLRAPMGSCVFTDEMERVAFLIGGIGITPVISILEYIVQKNLPAEADLFYSNRTTAEIAFHDELRGWAEAHPGLRLHLFVTREESTEGGPAHGRIDGEAVISRIGDPGERTFFVFGPPKMVEMMAAICREIGCRPDLLKTENFAGY